MEPTMKAPGTDVVNYDETTMNRLQTLLSNSTRAAALRAQLSENRKLLHLGYHATEVGRSRSTQGAGRNPGASSYIQKHFCTSSG